jgi:hypothetical protein
VFGPQRGVAGRAAEAFVAHYIALVGLEGFEAHLPASALGRHAAAGRADALPLMVKPEILYMDRAVRLAATRRPGPHGMAGPELLRILSRERTHRAAGPHHDVEEAYHLADGGARPLTTAGENPDCGRCGAFPSPPAFQPRPHSRSKAFASQGARIVLRVHLADASCPEVCPTVLGRAAQRTDRGPRRGGDAGRGAGSSTSSVDPDRARSDRILSASLPSPRSSPRRSSRSPASKARLEPGLNGPYGSRSPGGRVSRAADLSPTGSITRASVYMIDTAGAVCA